MTTQFTAATVHIIPLKLAARDGGFQFECDVPGIKVVLKNDQLHITLPKPGKSQPDHQFCYVIPDLAPTATEVYYAAIYSGTSLENLSPWPRQDGASRSPPVPMAAGEKGLMFAATVLVVPRAGPQPPVINEPPKDLGAAPTVLYARRHVKTDFQHGGEDLG